MTDANFRKPSIILYNNSDKEFNLLEFWKVNLNADLIGAWTGNGDEIQIFKNRLDPEQRIVNKATFDDIANEIYSLLEELHSFETEEEQND
tara:strand:+ start:821 stop:1093 length:273 start_codon:yes stop_codon:yes gene_type:complete